MPVHEFIQLWRIEYYAKNLHVCLIIIIMTFQICKSWGLLDSNSTKTRTGTCITQNQKDWRRHKLKHKHSQSPIGTGRPTTFEFSDLEIGQLYSKTITKVTAVVYRVLDQQRLF